MKNKLLFSNPQKMNDILGHSFHKKIECPKCSKDNSSWVLQFLYLSDDNQGIYECMLCKEKVEVTMCEENGEIKLTGEELGKFDYSDENDICCEDMEENDLVFINSILPIARYCPWCGCSLIYEEMEEESQ